MKTILSSRRDHYFLRVSVFLIVLALMAGMVGCDGQYILSISSDNGGKVTSPSEGTSSYDEGEVVNLVATPDAGYRFVEWTGNKGTIADVNNATTTITMYNDYSITARFVEGQEIRDWDDLDAIRNNLGGSHILMNDLDSTTPGYNGTASETADGGKGWQPIGTFTGSFDGRKYEIRNLFIKRPDKSSVGLFGYVGGGGIVQNITVVNATVTGKSSVGGLVGWNGGTVSSSNSSSNVTGSNEYVGGLVGRNQGTVRDSYSTGNVSGNEYVGGLVGYNEEGSVSNSSSSSNVTGSNDHVGGLVGWNKRTVSDSYSTGSVNGNEYVGGLVGRNQGTVRDSYSSSNVTGSNDHVGGLVGWNADTVSDSHSTGSVSGGSWVGALVGWNGGTVSNSYSTGSVNGSNEHVGGLVGWNEGTVSSSNSTGSVTGNEHVGGLVGWNKGTVSDYSHSSGSVTGHTWVGGLVGWNQGTVENSYSSANVTGNTHVGGLVGDNHFEGTVSESYSTGRVTGESSSSSVGGLVGYNEGDSVSNSYSTSNVTGDDYVGGLVGLNQGTVSESYSTGSITGKRRVGGLVGYNEGGSVSNSYSTGNVTGKTGNIYVGGLVGYNEGGSVSNSYSTGSVTGKTYVGGLVGLDNEGNVSSDSFWDIETSGQNDSDGGTGKNTEDMQDFDTFSGVAWDIIEVANPGTRNHSRTWNIVDDETYPFLSWQSVIQPAVAELLKSDKERITSPDVSTSEQALLVEGNSAFAFELYQELKQKEGNLFYSPYSISLALAMTYAGARGETAEQMADTLQFMLEQERLHPAFNWLDAELAKRGEGAEGQDEEGFRLNIVNAIWGQKDYEFLTDFLDVLAENYGAGLRILDFITEPEKSRVTINDWVSDQTEERIKDLIPPGMITALTRLVLTNAIYFNAAWEYPFNEDMTADGPFYLLDGGQVTVPMMRQTKSFGYAEGKGYQAVELLYDGGELSMVILLPASGNFETFEEGLQAQQVNDIIRGLQPTLVALTMPQFEFDSDFSLKDTLAGMGMPIAFSGDADFSGMTGNRELFISDVVHKAFVSVDEAGTEAAAATAVIDAGASPPEEHPVQVTIDRPFIFLIRDIETGAILFVGRVLNPGA
jgi:serpin B